VDCVIVFRAFRFVDFLRDGAGEITGLLPGIRLTNLGHDFLDASRSETVWSKFRQAVVKVGGGVSVPVANCLGDPLD
jgi:hypothetical protein